MVPQPSSFYLLQTRGVWNSPSRSTTPQVGVFLKLVVNLF